MEALHLLFQFRDLLLQAGGLGRTRQRWLLPIGAVELVQIRATLSSICAMRRSIFARVKFLSRLLQPRLL
jgi:hypothetical protein